METLELRFAVVDHSGNVVNTVIAGANYRDPDGYAVYRHDAACIGWVTTDSGVTFAAPAMAAADLLAYASALQNKVLSQLWTINVGTSDAPILLTTMLDPAGQNAMVKLALWAQVNAITGATEPYSNVDYSSANLSASQASVLSIRAGGIVSRSYGTLNSIAAQIKSGAITTTAQIDAVVWSDIPTAS